MREHLLVEQRGYGTCLPSQRTGRPRTGCRCQPRWITPRRSCRSRSLIFARDPVLPRSSSSQASLVAHRAQGRHIVTSGWSPRCTMRFGSSIDPQHQHCPGGGSEGARPVTGGFPMVRLVRCGRIVLSELCEAPVGRARSEDRRVSGRAGRPLSRPGRRRRTDRHRQRGRLGTQRIDAPWPFRRCR